MKKTCLNCSKEFDARRQKDKFCSLQCYRDYLKRQVKVIEKSSLKYIYRIVVMGDLHIGSIWAVIPLNGWKLRDGTILAPQNELQKWISECFQDFNLLIGIPDEIVYNGDWTDGFCDKTAGIGIWSVDKEDWKDVAKILHEMVTKGKDVKTYVLNSSAYHAGSQRGVNMDEEIAKIIGAEFRPHKLFLNHFGYLIQIQHQNQGISIINPSNMLKRDIENAKLHRIKHRPDLLIRNHQHIHSELVLHDLRAIGNGCWQGITDYIARKSGFTMPSIGGIIIDFYQLNGKIYMFPYYVGFKIPEELLDYIEGDDMVKVLEKRELMEQSVFGDYGEIMEEMRKNSTKIQNQQIPSSPSLITKKQPSKPHLDFPKPSPKLIVKKQSQPIKNESDARKQR